MGDRIENILVNDAAWPYEKDYWERGYLWEEDDEDEWYEDLNAREFDVPCEEDM